MRLPFQHHIEDIMNLASFLTDFEEAVAVFEDLKSSGILDKIKADAVAVEAHLQDPKVADLVSKLKALATKL